MKKAFTHEGLKEIKHDGPPAEVATELLRDPLAHLTNRMRKNCIAARQKYFASTATRKTLTTKVANRLRDRTLAWIGRELSRAGRQRRGWQRKYEALVAQEPKSPVIEARIAMLNLNVGNLDVFIEGAEDELSHRARLTRGDVDGYLFDPVTRKLFTWGVVVNSGKSLPCQSWQVFCTVERMFYPGVSIQPVKSDSRGPIPAEAVHPRR
jgi:hypothetical protein